VSHWDTPLGLATQHDKARARAAKLRKEADRLDTRADVLAQKYSAAIAKADERIARRLSELRQLA
jgi:membrane-anchored protein YejM (alkaline phosphatase superfamily)